MEEDNRFRQIIPYVVIRRGSEFLTYVRAVTGGENRLHGRMSLGIGGHIEFSDARNCHGIRKSAGGLNLSDIIEYAMCREVEEELGSGVMMNLCLRRFVGLLIDNSDEVGQVHLGYVLLFDVPDHWEWTRPEADEGEEGPAEFTEIKFMTLDEIANATNVQREGWVDLLLPALAPYALTGANSLKGQAVQ
jgi:predicted NUDIX family phosphoesterase